MSTSSNRICISVLPTCGYSLLFYNHLATRTFLISTAVMPDHRIYPTITCTSLSCRLCLFYTLKLATSISSVYLGTISQAYRESSQLLSSGLFSNFSISDFLCGDHTELLYSRCESCDLIRCLYSVTNASAHMSLKFLFISHNILQALLTFST